MQSSPVAMSQWSMRTCWQESMSMPSPLPPVDADGEIFDGDVAAEVGWSDHMRW